MSEKRTVVQPTAPFGCLACGAGEGEFHRQGCSHLRELNEAVRTLSETGAVSPASAVATPPAPTGEPGDPVQGSTAQADCSTAQADWRDSQPRLVSLGGPEAWDPQAVERLQESLEKQRRQPVILGPAPSGTFDIGPSANTKAIDELKGRVATLEAQAEAVGVGLSRCESSVAGMTTTHADRIETIEDEVRALKRAVLELRGLSFDAHRAASDQKLRILINGEPAPAPLSSFRISEAADAESQARCPRCGSDDPDRYITCLPGDTTEPHFKASCEYHGDSDPWHEIAKATQAPYAVGAKRPTHARLVRAVERWVGGYAIPAGTVLEIIGWSSDYPRIANPAAPENHPEPWFILHPGEWEACEGPTQAKGRPVVVCLCGSTRFMEAFQAANLRLTLEGKIVLSVGCNTKSDVGLGIDEATKLRLDELHKRKIDMADEVLVLNVGGYIGSSTRGEIQYAWDHGKRVTFLEPMGVGIGEVRSAVAWGWKRPDAAPAAPTQCPSCQSPDREHRLMYGNINDRYPCRDAWHGATPKATHVPPKPGSRVVRLLTDVRTPGGTMPKGTVAWVANWDAATGKAVIISGQGSEVMLNDEEWEAVP